MYCSKCGNEIADGSRFCSFCGSPVAEISTPAPEPPKAETPVSVTAPKKEVAPEPVRKPFIEDIKWDVNEYPTPDAVEKTEDIDFDWSADPSEIRDRLTREYPEKVKEEIIEKADHPAAELNVEDLIPAKPQAPEVPKGPAPGEELSAAEKIDKFYTFSTKNEEFQQLLNKEYDKIKGGSPIEQEKKLAEKAATERFETRAEDTSMEAFLDREGVNKPYEPKAFESDVLQRIEAREKELEKARAEEEARQQMIEEERAKAAAEKKAAQEARRRAEAEERERIAAEARARAAEEVRRAEEAARLAAEEAARAEEEAARLEAEAAARLAAEEEARREEDARIARAAVEEARRKAEERAHAEAEARIQAREEARIKAEEEAKAKAEEEARLAAEEETRRKEAEERARREAEEEERARQQAEKIKAQREARQAATEKEKRIAEIERRRQEEEQLRQSLDQKQENLRLQAESAAAAEEARKVLAQTARMREEEAAKIKAAIAGLRGETLKKPEPVAEPEPAPAPAAEPVPAPAAEPAPAPALQPKAVSEPTIEITADMFKAAGEPVPPALDRPTLVAKPQPEATPAPAAAPAPEAAPAPQPSMTKEEAAKLDAHRATQADLSDMAKARAKFLAEFGIDPISGKAPEQPQEAPIEPEEPAEPVPATVEELLGEKPVTGRATLLSENKDNIHTKTVNREEVLKGLEDTRRISKEELKAAPVIPAEELEATQLTDIDQIQHTKTVDDLLAELTFPTSPAELDAAARAEKEKQEEPVEAAAEPVVEAEPAPAEPVVPTEPVMPEPAPAVPAPSIPTEPTVPTDPVADEPVVPDIPEPVVEPEQAVFEGLVEKEEPTILPQTDAMAGVKPGLSDTIVMPEIREPEDAPEPLGTDESFADYGEKEAAQLRQMQEAQEDAGAFAPEVEVPAVEVSGAPGAPEMPAADAIGADLPEGASSDAADAAMTAGAIAAGDPKAAAKAAKAAAKAEKAAAKEAKKAAKKAEEKAPGGAGRTILKILLIILIIIFVIELAGIGIKWLAPDSGAAEFIDRQLNNVIQLITGSVPDYEIPGIDYEV